MAVTLKMLSTHLRSLFATFTNGSCVFRVTVDNYFSWT